MSVQDYSYLGRFPGPNIDVNLFPNAMNAGIQAGNAQQTVPQAIVNGAIQGVQTGIQTAQGIQNIELNQQKIAANDAINQVNTDPGVIQARKNVALAQGAIAKISGDAATLTQQTQIDTAQQTAQAQLDNAKITASDAASRVALQQVVGSGNPQQIVSSFTDPTYAGYYSRNPQAALQNINAARASGQVDPAILDPLQRQFEGMQYSQNLAGAKGLSKDLAGKYFANNATAASAWEGRMSTTPALQKAVTKPDGSYKDNFDPNLVDITPDPRKGNDPVTYGISYNGQILSPHAFTKDEVKDAHSQLMAWKLGMQQKTGITPAHLNAPTTAPTAAPQSNAVGLQQEQGPITEKDITPPQKATTPLDTNPILKGAVSLGGFAPDVVQATQSSFNDLGKTILSIAKSPEPYSSANKATLDSSVINTAKDIATHNFISSPALQASITQATVDQFNKTLEDSFGKAPSLTNDMFLGITGSDKKIAENFVPYQSLLSGLKIKTPVDYYFATQGSSLVKQVQDYATKILTYNRQVQELQAKKAAANQSQMNALKEIAGG